MIAAFVIEKKSSNGRQSIENNIRRPISIGHMSDPEEYQSEKKIHSFFQSLFNSALIPINSTDTNQIRKSNNLCTIY